MDDKMMNFMNQFIDSGNNEAIDEELYSLERKYSELFGHAVPREMLPSGISNERMKESLQKCIELGKDSLFELFEVKIDKSALY